MFKITASKGFHIYFENGWGISVQFGAGNYCQNHHADILDGDYYEKQKALGEAGSAQAEIAIFNPSGDMVEMGHKTDPDDYIDTVLGWQSPDQVLRYMTIIAALPPSSMALPESVQFD